jgi:5'-nucleotidase
MIVLGSGSIRKERMDPLFTYGDLKELFPYDDRVMLLKISGAHLRHMLSHMLRDETLDGGHGEFYQFSKGLKVTYNRSTRSFARFDFEGKPIKDDAVFNIGFQEYHHKNFADFFSLPLSELVDGKGMAIATSLFDVLEEYFNNTQQPDAQVEGRLRIV